MGLAESSGAKSYSHFIKSYSEVAQLRHDTFGDVRILEHKTRKGEKILEKQLSFVDEAGYNQALRMLELKAVNKWPFYCQILCYYGSTQWGCMAGNFQIKLAIEYFERSVFQLSLMGSQSAESMTALEENYGWRILSAMTQLCVLFKRYELSMGLISPENVLLTSDDEVKFLDMNLLTSNNSVFDRLKNRSLLTNYGISPEQMEQVRNGSNHPIDLEKTDIFCIGMFALCAMLSEPYKTFYNFSTNEIEYELIFKKIMKLKKATFSDDFTDILVSCLQKEAANRPTAMQLQLHVQQMLSQPRVSTQTSKNS